jgi:diguanylate cyclase (GGDEF)-like protein
MANEDLTARAAGQLVRVEALLRTPARRWVVLGAGVALAVALHAGLEDPGMAWLSAVPVVLAGLTAGGVAGATAGSIAALAHLTVDIELVGADLLALPFLGELTRTAALPVLGVLGSVVTRLDQQRDKAVFRSAMEDSVTGLLNVRAFYDELADLRAAGTPYSVLLADIAGMRGLNEEYGHPTGTEALRTLGHVLRRTTKERDRVARLGSDEIAIALVGVGADSAVTAAMRIAEQLAEESLVLPDGQRFQVHAYYGIASFPDDGDDEVAVLRRADHALRDAKRRGRDQIGVAPPPSSDGDG